jgi:hypothetical protein
VRSWLLEQNTSKIEIRWSLGLGRAVHYNIRPVANELC